MMVPLSAAVRAAVGRLSLRAKLILGFAVPTAALCLVIFIDLPNQLNDQSVAALRDKAQSIAAMTAFSVSPALDFGDRAGLDEAVAATLRNSDVSFLTIEDTTGKVVESWYGPASERGSQLEVVEPIRFQSGPGGRLRLGISLEAVEQGVARNRTQVAFFSVLVFLFGVAGATVLSTLVLRPVQRIVGTAQRIVGGDLSLRVGHHANDELGILAGAFDDMVEHLVTAQGALTEANLELEGRVAERTTELLTENAERKRAESGLRASESRLRAVFESAALGIVLLDDQGCVVDGNRAAARMVGRTKTEWVTQPFTDLVMPDDLAHVMPLLPPMIGRSPQAPETELHIRQPDGSVVCVRAAASLVHADPDRNPGVILVLADVTRQHELETRIRESQKLEAVGRLAGGVAHDFNNLLALIISTAELLIGDLPPDSQQAADVREIQHAGNRAARLTRQLLAIGRRQVVRRRPVDLNEVVRETLVAFQQNTGEHLLIESALADGLPQVHADPSLLREVLQNLAQNALDAMPGGGRLAVRTRVEQLSAEAAAAIDLAAAGPYVLIEVEDTGTGMDQRTVERIFEPFFSTKLAESRRVGSGAGLGLASVYGIVRQSGGAVAVQSELGRGSVFRVFLPPFVPQAPTAPAETGPAAARLLPDAV
jgi:PAS domain S-box-containing protein